MKSVIVLTVLLGCVASCLGAVSRGQYLDPAHPGKCAITKDLIIDADSIYNYPDRCVRILCESNGWAVRHTCGTMRYEIPPGCYLKEADVSLPYPECCKKHVVCDDANKINGH